VLKKAPINPSQVFFGDKGDSECFPSILPQKYAEISLITTQLTGNKNHIIPLYILEIIIDEKYPKIINII
jgi:hypothetical protein